MLSVRLYVFDIFMDETVGVILYHMYEETAVQLCMIEGFISVVHATIVCIYRTDSSKSTSSDI